MAIKVNDLLCWEKSIATAALQRAIPCNRPLTGDPLIGLFMFISILRNGVVPKCATMINLRSQQANLSLAKTPTDSLPEWLCRVGGEMIFEA